MDAVMSALLVLLPIVLATFIVPLLPSVSAAALLLSLQWGFILVHISDSIIILLYTRVCV